MTILPLTYLGNIEYFAALLSGGCVIDLYENYIKQTYRNRCDILTANGVSPLTVNVVKGGSKVKRPVRDIRIDYSKKWQHQHWRTLVSAYRGSPYFDHYEGRFAPFYDKRFGFLADLNMSLLEVCADILGKEVAYGFSAGYVIAGPDDRDMRGAFEPSRINADIDGGGAKENFPPTGPGYRGFSDDGHDAGTIGPAGPAALDGGKQKSPGFVPEPYYQVFSERFPFFPNLSIIDLIFCEGPGAISVLKGSARSLL